MAWHGLSASVLEWMQGLDVNLYVLAFIMVAILVVIGMFMETIAQIFIFSPVFFPVMVALSLVKAISDLHCGTIHVGDNAPGLRVTITFDKNCPLDD